MAQQRYFDVLTQRVRADRYPSLDLLDRIEACLATDEQLADYVNLLIDKMHETRYPSKDIMDRIQRMAPQVPREAAPPPAPDAGAVDEDDVKGALTSEEDLPIANYSDLTAEEVNAKLPELSQLDLAKVDAYERREQSRSTVLDKISSLRGDEPWPGYDEQTAADISAALRAADGDTADTVRRYESAHKNRRSVIKATEGKPAAVS